MEIHDSNFRKLKMRVLSTCILEKEIEKKTFTDYFAIYNKGEISCYFFYQVDSSFQTVYVF